MLPSLILAHLVCYHHKGKLWINISEVTRLIINWYPEGLEETDVNGDLPIHLAIKQDAPQELLYFILMVWPDCSKGIFLQI